MSSENEMKNEAAKKDEIENHEEDGWGRFGGRGHRGGPCGRSKLWFIPLVLLAIAAKGALVWALWNHLIPELFHGPELKYFQAIGLLILAKLILGMKPGHGFRGRGGFGRHHEMKKKFWAKMTDEERNKLKDHLRKRWKE